MKVLVKGAGVAGLAVAHEFSARGVQVEVADRAKTVGPGASGLAGGMLAAFCEREVAGEIVLTLGQGAANWWEAVLPGHVTRNGTLVVTSARDAAELARFATRTRGYAWLEAAEIAVCEPALAGRFRKALFFPYEAHLDPRAALTSLYRKLAGQGVRFHFEAPDLPNADFDWVIECTGAHAIGTVPELRGVRGEMLHLQTQEFTLSRPVRLLHPRHPVYVVPRGDGRFMVGATMLESDDAGPVSARSLMELLNTAYAVHPAFGEARVIETGAGVRPAFPDNLPRVCVSGRTVRVNGLYRHGFLLAPGMARQAADAVTATNGQAARVFSA